MCSFSQPYLNKNSFFKWTFPKSYSEGQLLNYICSFSVLFTKYFYSFLLDSEQIISPFNISKSFFPRESVKSLAWNTGSSAICYLPFQLHSQVFLIHNPTHVSHWAPLHSLNIPHSFRPQQSLHVFRLPEVPFSRSLPSQWTINLLNE